MSEPSRIAQIVDLANWLIPDDLWADLKKLAAGGARGAF
jgi:hypothetical protein